MFEDMRILVVEDDKKIASFVVNGLKQSGYAVDHAVEVERLVPGVEHVERQPVTFCLPAFLPRQQRRAVEPAHHR